MYFIIYILAFCSIRRIPKKVLMIFMLFVNVAVFEIDMFHFNRILFHALRKMHVF